MMVYGDLRLSRFAVATSLVFLSVAAGCAPDGPAGDAGGRTIDTKDPLQAALAACPEPVGDDALAEDAAMYAEDSGVSAGQGVTRLRLQECYASALGELERSLRRHEAESYGGLWIQHEPHYRFVVFFKDDAEERVAPYIKGRPFAPLVDARSGADASLDELAAAQEEAGLLLDELGVAANSTQNIQKSRVELELPRPERLEAALSRHDRRLPEHVVVIRGALARPSVG